MDDNQKYEKALAIVRQAQGGGPLESLAKELLHWVNGSTGPNVRKADIMEVPKHFDFTHFRGITRAGRKFVYCPTGNICSWNPGDYDHEWCHWCQQFFSEKVEGLLGPDEQHRKLP